MAKQDKFTKAARGRDCQVRIPGVCNFNPETTVLAHYRMAGTCGVGMKPVNIQGAWCCSACHDAIDFRSKTEFDEQTLRLYHAEGCFRTNDCLIAEGIIK